MDLINIFLIIVGITNLFLALIIYFNTKETDKINVIFTLLALNVSLWSIAMAFFRGATSYETAVIALKILYVIPIFIPILFSYFTYIFLKEKYRLLSEKNARILLYLWSAFMIIASLKNKFVTDVQIRDIGEKIISFGDWYYIYIAHFVFFFGAAFIFMIRSFLRDKNALTKKQIKYLFLGTFISSSIGMATNLIIPWFGYYGLNWVGNIFTIFFVGFILYAILKYKLFDTKVIATEIFIVFIIITLFVDLFFTTSTTELIIKSLILISVAMLSYLIIKSVYKEIATREKIEKLAEDLKIANKRLIKLDKQKSEFVSIASHQLRAPIASLKGYSSMIMEGSYGPVSTKVMDVINRLFQSSQSLALIIDDFLNLSRIERGRIEFSFDEGNLKDIVEQAITEIKPRIEEKKIKLTKEIIGKDYKSNMDIGKIKQVITNLLDNSLKYTPKGSIDIKLSKTDDNKILLMIRDTGIGLPKDKTSQLFEKFKRLDNANDANISGTGLGLFLAKTIIEAHKGKIWAESEGEGLGSTFFVELKGV